MIAVHDLSPKKLKSFLLSESEPAYRADQVLKWLYHKEVESVDQMTNLAQTLRDKLIEKTHFISLTLAQKQLSTDGTIKYLFSLRDKQTIESVYIPSGKRKTLCISTQVGCRLGCRFCLTARQGLMRQLSPGEIVAQVRAVQKMLNCRLTNIVMMGMGEPFDNFENVIDAIDLLTSQSALGFSSKRITVSTVGLVPEIIRFGREGNALLAISLNAPNDDIRTGIMPINKKYNMAALYKACKNYPLKNR